MCAAVPAALLLLVVFAALTVVRLSKDAPNARLLAGLLESLGNDSGTARRQERKPPSDSAAMRPGPAGAV
ncbi:hypothetical protein LF599_17115 [Pseudodesulfovibrio thermohalotolerans]|uniref:hypothetical protein n=1 Tax=Pseudodesulfovibrio thermohalotolerans TaxID=2880651 RepID=UPI0022BA0A86|nr:hypothetical protein [Pseudodesulfovibrio thermohalotolerans]WFS62359.1 hypothetical protein LF599_17115 [Pseudodesulfovibrio thermohalotolerans]